MPSNAYEVSLRRDSGRSVPEEQGLDVPRRWAAVRPGVLGLVDHRPGRWACLTQPSAWTTRGSKFPGSHRLDHLPAALLRRAPSSARSPGPSRPPVTSPTTCSPTRSSSTTWTTAPCRYMSSAATPTAGRGRVRPGRAGLRRGRRLHHGLRPQPRPSARPTWSSSRPEYFTAEAGRAHRPAVPHPAGASMAAGSRPLDCAEKARPWRDVRGALPARAHLRRADTEARVRSARAGATLHGQEDRTGPPDEVNPAAAGPTTCVSTHCSRRSLTSTSLRYKAGVPVRQVLVSAGPAQRHIDHSVGAWRSLGAAMVLSHQADLADHFRLLAVTIRDLSREGGTMRRSALRRQRYPRQREHRRRRHNGRACSNWRAPGAARRSAERRVAFGAGAGRRSDERRGVRARIVSG